MTDTSDFFGLNHYTTALVTSFENAVNSPSYYNDQDIQESQDPSWTKYVHLFWFSMIMLFIFIHENFVLPKFQTSHKTVTFESVGTKNEYLFLT